MNSQEGKEQGQQQHSHPILGDRTALPPKRVSPKLIIPVQEPSVNPAPRKKRVGCCG